MGQRIRIYLGGAPSLPSPPRWNSPHPAPGSECGQLQLGVKGWNTREQLVGQRGQRGRWREEGEVRPAPRQEATRQVEGRRGKAGKCISPG